MKHTHLFSRLTAFMMAMVMLLSFAACGDNSTSPDASSQASSSASQIPAFINPLPDVDLNAIAKPELPSAEIREKLNTAYNQNNDVVGWLRIPNTEIDNEVLQGADNNVYLRSDITKGYNWYGCYYADYECLFGDRNSISKDIIIYGHSMNDDPNSTKFSQLKKYVDPEFAKNNPYLYFSTPEDNLVYKVFSVMYTDTNLAYIHPNLKGNEFMKLVSELKDRSQFDFDVDVNSSDKLLTLSTCTYIYGNREDQRFVVVGRLLRPGEEIEPTVKLEKNADVKPPQFK